MIEKTIRKVIGDTTIRRIQALIRSDKEKHLMKIRRAFYLQFLGTNDTYFDVGANYGNRIEPIINDGIRIVAIEPQPQCVNFLTKHFKDKISVVPKGLGSEVGELALFLSDSHVVSSFSQEWIKATKESGRFGKTKWDRQQITLIDTLDNLIAQFGKPQFIKIDVEGYELEVLNGLNHPIRTISFEYTIPEGRISILKCMDRISEISENRVVLFNYSIGESMEWALDSWLSLEEMKEEVDSDRFVHSEFGDIYSKTEV